MTSKITDNLEEKFWKVYGMRNKTRRGYAFEELVADIFKREDFDVQLNSKSAKPRQSDLLVVGEDSSILVEAKWRKNKLEVGDVAELKDRLRRVPIHIIGAIFSISGFSKKAIQEVESDRAREILLFNGIETKLMCEGKTSIHDLI